MLQCLSSAALRSWNPVSNSVQSAESVHGCTKRTVYSLLLTIFFKTDCMPLKYIVIVTSTVHGRLNDRAVDWLAV